MAAQIRGDLALDVQMQRFQGGVQLKSAPGNERMIRDHGGVTEPMEQIHR